MLKGNLEDNRDILSKYKLDQCLYCLSHQIRLFKLCYFKGVHKIYESGKAVPCLVALGIRVLLPPIA